MGEGANCQPALLGLVAEPIRRYNDPDVSGSQTGPELYKRRVVEFTASFPDLRFTIEDRIAEKGKVVVCWIIR